VSFYTTFMAWNTISASERLSALNASFKKLAQIKNSRERLIWFFSR